MRLPNENPEKAIPRQPGGLLAVFPSDLGEEWRRRTRYGKSRILLMLPMYVVVWAMVIGFAVVVLTAFMAVTLLWKIGIRVYDRWPEVYRSHGE